MGAYCSREDVMSASDVKTTAYIGARLDRAILAASAELDTLCHRRFLPEIGTFSFELDPDATRTVRFGEHDVLAVASITDANGDAISVSDYTLYPLDGGTASGFRRPYTKVVFDVAPADPVVIVGTFGYQKVITAVTTQVGTITDSATTMTVTSGADIGVGFHYQLGTEWVLCTGRTFVDTTSNLAAIMGASSDTDSLTVSNVAEGEVLLIGSERMLVLAVAGSTAVVARAYDGSTLASHAISDDIYALRGVTIRRAQLGTTTAAHTDATVSILEVPAEIRKCATGIALDIIAQETSSYARSAGTGDQSVEMKMVALARMKDDVTVKYGRHRLGVV